MRIPFRALSPAEAASSRVCLSCRRLQHRPFSTTSSLAAPPAPPPPPVSGLAPLPSRQLLSVAGPDAAKFLQGIITSNILPHEDQPRQDSFYSGFLSATGRVLHDVFIYADSLGIAGQQADEPAYLIEADATRLDTLAKYIKRYKLRAKVKLRKITPDELQVWQAWGSAADAQLQNSSVPVSGGLVLKDPRAPNMGYRLLHPGSKAPEMDLEEASEDAYTIRRYLNGVPEGQDEILRETALPQESNMDYMNGIDYNKGCYVGQELTIRTKHRGVVRKRILPCIVYDKSAAPPESLHYDPEGAASPNSPPSPEAITADMIPQDTSIGRYGKRGRSAGKWLKGVGNIGLGLCRLEIMTGIQLPGETAATAFSPDDEFLLEWGGDDESGTRSGVKVKAFVPDWVQAGLDATTQRS